MIYRRTVLRTAACGLLIAGCGAGRTTRVRSQVPKPSETEAIKLSNPTQAIPPTVRPLLDGPPAPELNGGGEWINSAPLTIAGLRGKVVLIDFWTYGCYNCRNTLPAMQGWWKAFNSQGLVIIGVHTPEFRAEHEIANVQQVVIREEIGWPVIQDNDYAIWNAYRNHYWPHFFLVSRSGKIIYDHIGEGAYDVTTQKIADALVEPA